MALHSNGKRSLVAKERAAAADNYKATVRREIGLHWFSRNGGCGSEQLKIVHPLLRRLPFTRQHVETRLSSVDLGCRDYN